MGELSTRSESNVLRPMVLADVDDVVLVQESGAVRGLIEVFPQDQHPFPRDQVADDWRREVVDPRIACYAVIDDDRIAGFAATRGNELLHFGIDVRLWGHGLATTAHDAVMVRLRSEGHDHAWLNVFTANRRARRFYEKLGWQATGERTLSAFAPHPELLRYGRSSLL